MASPSGLSEITVRGAGIFGLACAFALARRGARVAVVDPSGPGAGASGGVVGALAPHAPEGWTPVKAFQRDSLLAAPAFWAAVAAAGGADPGYLRSGRLQAVPDAAALARAHERAEAARGLWGGAALWEVIPAAGTGWEPASPSGWLVRDTLSARLHPRRALAALEAALAALGVPVLRDAPDRGPVLHATGHAGLADLSAALGREVGRPLKGQAAVLGHAAPEQPQLYTGGLHVVPHADGTTAVGSADDREAADTATDDRLEALIARARSLVPALAGAPVLERWAGLRPRSRSRRMMLGPWPGRPGHFVANGGFKTGFGLAPGVADVMAALLLDGEDRIPAGCRVEDNL